MSADLKATINEAIRRHRPSLHREAKWWTVCSCGWTSPRYSTDFEAVDEHAEHRHMEHLRILGLYEEWRTLEDGWSGQMTHADGSVTSDFKAPTRQRRWVTRWVDKDVRHYTLTEETA